MTLLVNIRAFRIQLMSHLGSSNYIIKSNNAKMTGYYYKKCRTYASDDGDEAFINIIALQPFYCRPC